MMQALSVSGSVLLVVFGTVTFCVPSIWYLLKIRSIPDRMGRNLLVFIILYLLFAYPIKLYLIDIYAQEINISFGIGLVVLSFLNFIFIAGLRYGTRSMERQKFTISSGPKSSLFAQSDIRATMSAYNKSMRPLQNSKQCSSQIRLHRCAG